MAIFRVQVDGAVRLAVGDPTGGPSGLLDPSITVDGLLAQGAQRLAEVGLAEVDQQGSDAVVPPGASVLAPVESQEIWAAGVTYLRSRIARGEESRNSDPYDLVYDADRPELFMKCAPGRVRGPGQSVGIRRDSTWDVPEPELTLVFDAHGQIAAFTIGNDVSSRSIEGENTLYLPQAKTFTASGAVGPCLALPEEVGDPTALSIRLVIERAGDTIVDERTSTGEMRRGLDDLGRWLFAANEFPCGVLLMTGTGIVPHDDVTLMAGDVVHISIDGLGTLTNPVEAVGRPGGS